MDNFKKIMMGKYIIKLIPEVDVDNYNFDDLLDEIKTEYALSKSEISYIHYNSNKSLGKNAQKELKKKLINIIKSKIINIKEEKSLIKNQIEYIKELCSLNNTEYNILLFLTLIISTKIGRCLSDCYNDEIQEHFFEQYLKIDKYSQKIICNALTEKGILIDNNSRFSKNNLYLNPNIIDIINSNKINSYEKVKKILLGKPEKSELKWNDFDYYGEKRDIVLNILKSAVKNKIKGINILLYGGVGTGKTQFAKMIANKAKINQYQVIFEKENKEEANREDRIMDLYSKETMLEKIENSCILFDEAEDLFNRHYSSKAYLNNILENTSVPIFWTTNDIYNVDPAVLRRMTYTIEFEKMPEEHRLNIWMNILKKTNFDVDYEKIKQLNKYYDISPSIIENAVKTSKLINGNQNDFEMFVENVAQVVSKKRTIKKKKEFEMSEYDIDLINTDLDMNKLTQNIKSCGKLNFSLCLYGEPGTGKSLYARYLAKELGIEVIQKRASDLVSKWVGETEENIAKAFAEAKAKKAMLIFDEADSFLQNRGNASYNWEVSQVNEMLTWMESHEYPFVCTTNLLDTLDEASLRRFTFKIKFDFMNNNQVNQAIEHFFNIKDSNVNIKGLTAGDFSTVKKKADFLNITDLTELSKMLYDEVKLKNSNNLKSTIGF